MNTEREIGLSGKTHGALKHERHPQSGTGIIVFGHTRPGDLKNVLQSLRRQQHTCDVHVWLDGHSGRSLFVEGVERCRRLVRDEFPECALTEMQGQIGIEKLTLDGLAFMSALYKRIIVLEDDCFPTASAIETFEQALDLITVRSDVYSVYGHHFLVPAEGETITRFQGWGWATTSAKLAMILPELQRCFAMPEAAYREWVIEQLTPDIRQRLDVTPGRNCMDVMQRFYSWDSCTCLLTARRGLLHQKTARRIIYNCGMGDGSGHFAKDDLFRKPPFNMIASGEVWDYFNDADGPDPADTARLLARGEQLYAEGNLQEARAAFLRALNNEPACAEAHNNLGVLYWQSGDSQKAEVHLSRALELTPDAPHVVQNYSELLKRQQRITEARSMCSGYLERNPGRTDIQQLLASIE